MDQKFLKLHDFQNYLCNSLSINALFVLLLLHHSHNELHRYTKYQYHRKYKYRDIYSSLCSNTSGTPFTMLFQILVINIRRATSIRIEQMECETPYGDHG
eukprot:5207_1